MIERLDLDRRDPCVACQSSTIFGGWAVISPWIRELAEVKQRTSVLTLCPVCGSGQFSYRYTDVEMAKIYENYRLEPYFRVRNKWEPTYTNDLNTGIGSHPQALLSRQAIVRTFLQHAVTLVGCNDSVLLDVGGDCGQFIPPEIDHRIVVDVSSSQPIEGVTRFNQIQDARAWNPEFVVMSGILEHLANPTDFIRQTYAHLGAPKSTVFYFEVPAGVPASRRGFMPLLGSRLAIFASISPLAWRRLDRYVARRRRLGKVDHLRITRQTEHLNFFSSNGLQNLLENCGLEVLKAETYDMPSVLNQSGRLEFSRVLCMSAVWR